MKITKSLKLILALFLFSFTYAAFSANANDDSNWVASWGASPLAFRAFGNAEAPPPFSNQTVRQILRLSVGGDAVRIRFSNEIGSNPLVIGSASVAIANEDFSIQTNTLHKLTFGGEESITVPAGSPALSDPIELTVKDLEQLAVSLYLPEETPVSTLHGGRISFTSSAGDFTLAENLAKPAQSTTMVFLTGVYVKTSEEVNVLVALGDSITDGTASTPYTFNNWPALLAERLSKMTNRKKLGIINHGIAGNQVLNDGAGVSALARFDRDVLSTPGLTHIILMEGINDIGTGGFAFGGGPAPAMRSAEDIISGYQQLIARAHSMSPPLKIYGATLTPFEGTFAGYYTPEKDIIRNEVNEWIRSSGTFDAVIDFDVAIQDPDNPLLMKAEYNSGDSLHPGDAGYQRMADWVDLNLFND